MGNTIKSQNKFQGKSELTIGVDAGDNISGICIVESRKVISGFIENNKSVISEIKKYKNKKPIIVIEDVKPYSLQLSQQVIDTCKFIGELKYRLKYELKLDFVLKPRSEVKLWVYNSLPDVCIPRIKAKIESLHIKKEKNGKKGLMNANGEMRSPSFVFVDDRIIIAAMKQCWQIPTPKVGKPTMYGLSTHSWQALALITSYIDTEVNSTSSDSEVA